MPINSTHAEYEAHYKEWEKCQDFYDGMAKVKLKKDLYLPRLSNQTNEKYDLYRFRSGFFGATARTVDGMVGSVMRKPPVVNLPESLEYILESATLDGMTLFETIKSALIKLFVTGRYGILVDVPSGDVSINSDPLTASIHDPNGNINRPYMVLYNAQDIINWGSNFVVLREVVYEATNNDRYALDPVEQFRELVLEDGVYKVRIYRSVAAPYGASVTPTMTSNRHIVGSSNSQEVWEFDEYIPTIRGTPLDFIPFVVSNVHGQTYKITKPPLLDLVDENHSHYITSADIEWARHWVAVPTPWASGIENDPNNPIKLEVGGETAWLLPDPACRAGYLEFTGQGLTALENALHEKESRMAALGARLIEPRRTQVETAESARVRQSGETSVVVSIINHIEASFNRALQFVAVWLGADEDDIALGLNRELMEAQLTANDVIALLSAVQQGRISHETFYNILEDANYTRAGDSFEEEIERIKEQFDILGLAEGVKGVKQSDGTADIASATGELEEPLDEDEDKAEVSGDEPAVEA